MEEHRARKRFGQNFLVDGNIIRNIVAAIDPKPAQAMVEIGPGLGAMTRPLAARLDRLHVIEIDRDLAARLREGDLADRLVIHEQDALKFDFGALSAEVGSALRVVGNLPYNISSPLLFHLADHATCVTDLTFMLQKEVVDRIVAAPDTEAFGRLSVMLQYRFECAHVFDVPPGAFRPMPKVMSAIVQLRPRPVEQLTARDPQLMSDIVKAAFGQRRKTLRNTLREWLTPDDWVALGIDASRRGETLGVADYVRIANHVTDHAAADGAGAPARA
jgi:16S rRNA (adenine1518-N6/adenine1519-N6)-dimethyltransferase